ncbi:hypothetical protein GCM10008929_18120 [Alkalibacterium psychrotolerans]
MSYQEYNQTNVRAQSYFKFDRMITPRIIEIIFVIGLVVTVLAGLAVMSQSVLAGILIILIGPLMIRINCELIIVVFKIHEALQDIRQR